MGNIPPITQAVLLLGLFFFITNRIKHLAYLASISIIFLNAYIAAYSTHIRPGQLVYTLFILLVLLNMVLSKKNGIHFSKKYDRPLIFALYIIPASLLANLLAAGELVKPAYLSGFGSNVLSELETLVPLEPTSALVTQNLFVIFPILIYYSLRKLDAKTLQKCIHYFIYAVVFLTVWNICNMIEFAISENSVMRNITNMLIGRTGSYGSTQGLGIIRIGGFVGEPSHYSYVALPAFGYALGMSITDTGHQRKWHILTLIFIFGTIVSFSTSGFVGIIIISLIYLIYNLKMTTFFRVTIYMAVILVVGVYLFRDFITAYYQYNMGKISLGQGSYAVRIWSIKHSLLLLSKHPLIGIGIGSTGSLGGVATVFTCIGIIGVSFLIYLFIWVFPIYSKSILFSLYAIIIFNIITGDLSTFFSPISALLLAYASKVEFRNNYNYT